MAPPATCCIAHLVSDCLPLPPTPTNMALPLGCRSTRANRVTCSTASLQAMMVKMASEFTGEDVDRCVLLVLLLECDGDLGIYQVCDTVKRKPQGRMACAGQPVCTHLVVPLLLFPNKASSRHQRHHHQHPWCHQLLPSSSA